MKFGLKILKIIPALHASKNGKPALVGEPPDPIQLFQHMQYNDVWNDAAMPEVVAYLRGNRHLNVPPQWRHLLPMSL